MKNLKLEVVVVVRVEEIKEAIKKLSTEVLQPLELLKGTEKKKEEKERKE